MKKDLGLIASLDMGTTKVSAMIAEKRNGIARVIGVGTTASDGLKHGVIVDIDGAAASIEKAVKEAERMAGVSVKYYSVGVAGEHIRSMNSSGVVAIPNLEAEITKEDVSRAITVAQNFSMPYDREIIHTLPTEFIVDEQRGIRQPAGMYGSRLEVRVHVVTASRAALDNIAKALLSAGVEPQDLIFEPLASCRAVLTEEEQELGVMLIDIGGGTTDVMIIVEKGVHASGVIGLGGNDVTSDIAYGLRTAQTSAEEIKIRHGCALSTMVPAGETIEVPGIGFKDKRVVGRQLLAGIIEPRMKELFSLIDEQITKNDFKISLGAGVVLTGGSSMLESTRELAEQIFDLPVRIGSPGSVDGLIEVVSHPMFATGVGLLLYDGEMEQRGRERKSISGWWRNSLGQIKRAIASFI
ncbi:MAG: cell division protein FtsA [Candidatus Latescibacteria bacterium]|nr:cell division protein FtsA [Candidatus Latescibacterota bacterium]NIM21068.1 cell division protein FtsA [Candidatus Latescibacterota bacterium]NIM65203.1 cell division protein FtsA [Candidatus Latescibacterota bacterium]NIO01718.1 cell division protein FtsA [Candidatus Latescibacterota bacterium]NIO28235.1 cell division protein FtsA [Candidatus Latescibacterota bacterium]